MLGRQVFQACHWEPEYCLHYGVAQGHESVAEILHTVYPKVSDEADENHTLRVNPEHAAGDPGGSRFRLFFRLELPVPVGEPEI